LASHIVSPPELDKPEPKRQNYQESTKGHESTKKRFPKKFVLSWLSLRFLPEKAQIPWLTDYAQPVPRKKP
jgi:hypothetical protein